MKPTITRLAVAAGVLCAGVLAISLVGSGVGASFIKSLTAKATIETGTFSCQLTNTTGNPDVKISTTGQRATVTLPPIESSTAGQSTAPVQVENTGTMPLFVSWVISTSGAIFTSGHVSPAPVISGTKLDVAASETYTLGFKWTTLSNVDLGRSGTATYTADCTDYLVPSDLSLFSTGNGTAEWNQTGTISLSMAAAPSAGAAAGVQLLTQVSTLPATAPTFVTNNYHSGSPRWLIEFTTGQLVVGYPSSANTTSSTAGKWAVTNGSTYVTWATITSHYGSDAISEIYIVMTATQPGTTDNISTIQYDAVTLLGS